jgi:hypothetical protein
VEDERFELNGVSLYFNNDNHDHRILKSSVQHGLQTMASKNDDGRFSAGAGIVVGERHTNISEHYADLGKLATMPHT